MSPEEYQGMIGELFGSMDLPHNWQAYDALSQVINRYPAPTKLFILAMLGHYTREWLTSVLSKADANSLIVYAMDEAGKAIERRNRAEPHHPTQDPDRPF